MTPIQVVSTKIDLPPKLLLVPFSPVAGLLEQKKPLRRFTLLLSRFLIYANFATVTRFFGYPHLLTLLETIRDVRKKEIYFLGTAGSIAQDVFDPVCLNINKIYSSSIFRNFSREDHLPLLSFPGSPFENASGVSVDLIQRETRRWLKHQLSRNITAVDMELFPLRAYLRKPFSALVVTTDRVDQSRIQPFLEKEKVKGLFLQALHFISKVINENQNHSQ